MDDPFLSPWLRNLSSIPQAIRASSEDSSGLASPKETVTVPDFDTSNCHATSHNAGDYVDDGDIVLRGLNAASELLTGVTIKDEDTVFHAVMDEIISIQVQTVAHIPKSVRPLLAEILASELQQAQFNGIWGFVRLFALVKAALRLPPRGGKRKRCVVSSLLFSD